MSYTYSIGTYEVTNTEYCEFLNAVAATDTYSLYDTNMASTAAGGIVQSGSSGSYTYTVKSGFEDKPVTYVSLFDAARYVNWLSTGNTETGVYASLGGATSGRLSLFARDATAWNAGGYAITSENEWYKAAYYKGGSTNAGYWIYATQSDTVPTAAPPNGAANQANYSGSGVSITPVGAYTGSASAYGTYDQNGNLWEIMDTPYDDVKIYEAERGGGFINNSAGLASSVRYNYLPDKAPGNLGFRIVRLGAVPEPATYGLMGAGAAALAAVARRRKK